jgi:hypothetical protein
MVFDTFILANAVTVVVYQNSIAWIFWSAFIVEMLLKIYTFGAKRFFSQRLNWYVRKKQPTSYKEFILFIFHSLGLIYLSTQAV